MPRAKIIRETPKKLTENRLLWGQYGTTEVGYALTGWDPKPQLVDALLEVLQSGATIVLRPGSGRRSIGVAIWEGDTRHPPQWCYLVEELDEWARCVIEQANARTAAAVD